MYDEEEEKHKEVIKSKEKRPSAFKSVTSAAKSWGNKLSPKLARKRQKSAVALLKVCGCLPANCVI